MLLRSFIVLSLTFMPLFNVPNTYNYIRASSIYESSIPIPNLTFCSVDLYLALFFKVLSIP